MRSASGAFGLQQLRTGQAFSCLSTSLQQLQNLGPSSSANSSNRSSRLHVRSSALPGRGLGQAALPSCHEGVRCRQSRRGTSVCKSSSAASSADDDVLAGAAGPDATPSDLASSSSSSSSEASANTPSAEPQLERWRVPLVPWGLGKVVTVVVLWLLAYVIMGQVAIPILLDALGLDRDLLSTRGHALLHLGLDLSQLTLTLGILWGSLRQFPLRALGLFPVRFWPPAYVWVVLLGCLTFPVVDAVSQHSVSWFSDGADVWATQLEESLSLGDWVTNISYFLVFSICAPVWEEAMFRGFLLTSLARHMPTWAAVLASSLVFAMCHFKMQTLLPLLMLGSIFSTVFLYTRNLVPCIILHSLWNVYVLVVAMGRPF